MGQSAGVDPRRALQEEEYRLPQHWILRNHGLANYLHKSDVIARLLARTGRYEGDLLDLGCGDGRGSFELAERLGPGWRVRGVDFSERAITFARLMAPDLIFDVQDGMSLGFPDGTFDVVVGREVIEHVPPDEVAAFLAEARRVLRPGGWLLLTTPSTNRRVPPKHHQHFTEDSLRAALEDGDFAVEAVEGLGWFPSSPRVERVYRSVIALPALWRIDAWCGSRALPPDRADDLLVLARTP